VDWERWTHGDVGHLADRVVLEVSGLLMIALPEVDGDEVVRYVALFGYHSHETCVSGHRRWGSVELECHL
jgi:hypothetical protein